MTQFPEKELRFKVVTVVRQMYQRGYICATEGNISVRLDESTFLITPTFRSKWLLEASELIVIGKDGNKISGKLEPSSEYKMHLECYKARPDINAVIHAHPPYSTALTVAGLSIATKALPEVLITLGDVPVCPFETTGTESLSKAVGDLVKTHNGILLDRHGSVTVGKTLFEAYDNLERVEWASQVTLLAHGKGELQFLTVNQILDLPRQGRP